MMVSGMLIMLLLLIGLVTVSYTHLDVYKRQEVEWTISLTNHGPHTDNNCYVNGIKLEDIVGFTPSKGTFDAAIGDVYKRQSL